MLGLTAVSEVSISALPVLNYVDATSQIDVAATVTATANFDARGFGNTSAASSTAAACERVKDAVSAVSVASTTASSCKRVRLADSEIDVESSTTITGRYTARGFAEIDSESETLISYERVRYLNAASTNVTSGTVGIGREKWEPITDDTNIWTEIAS
jgi:hypothetical protein